MLAHLGTAAHLCKVVVLKVGQNLGVGGCAGAWRGAPRFGKTVEVWVVKVGGDDGDLRP